MANSRKLNYFDVAPTTPTDVVATATAPSQVNVTWKASTDNIGVAAYEVYRQADNDKARKVAEVSGTSFGDASLKPATAYTYHVIARDGGGNRSDASVKALITTPAQDNLAVIKGRVFNGKTNKPIANARIEIMVDGRKTYLYHKQARGVRHWSLATR